MFCDNCGSELRDNAAFCPKCGTAITTETDPVKSTKTHSSPDYRDGYTNHTEDGSTTQAVWNYSRDYRFHDSQLVFAFVFDGTEEHRLYFKDDHMIRYIDERHTTYDYPDSAQFSYWENKVLREAYTLIESNKNNITKKLIYQIG